MSTYHIFMRKTMMTHWCNVLRYPSPSECKHVLWVRDSNIYFLLNRLVRREKCRADVKHSLDLAYLWIYYSVIYNPLILSLPHCLELKSVAKLVFALADYAPCRDLGRTFSCLSFSQVSQWANRIIVLGIVQQMARY